MHIKFQKNGVTREVKIGFSWTTLFFGMWVPLLRGMFVPTLIFVLTLGFAGFYYMFAINRIYARHLKENGWNVVPGDVQAAQRAWGFV